MLKRPRLHVSNPPKWEPKWEQLPTTIWELIYCFCYVCLFPLDLHLFRLISRTRLQFVNTVLIPKSTLFLGVHGTALPLIQMNVRKLYVGQLTTGCMINSLLPLEKLTNLQRLTIRACLSPSVDFRGLVHLKVLKIQWNSTITMEDSNLPSSLEKLRIGNPHFCSFSGNLFPFLTNLELVERQNSIDLKGNFPKLKWLILTMDRYSTHASMLPLPSMLKLKHLIFRQNPVCQYENVVFFGWEPYKLQSLFVEYINQKQLEDIAIAPLSNLKQLHLGACPLLTNLDLLSRLQTLQCLKVSNCPHISNIHCVEHLSQLEELYILFCPLVHVDPVDMAKWKQTIRIITIKK